MSSPHAAPLRFRNPPGWPDPSAAWVIEHQGWEPEAGWVPEPTAPPRPADWRLWERDPGEWARQTRPARAALRRRLVVAIVAGAIGIVAAFVGVASGFPPHGWFAVLALVALWPLTLGVLHRSLLARIDARTHRRVVESAADRRRLGETLVARPAGRRSRRAIDSTGASVAVDTEPEWAELLRAGMDDVPPARPRRRIGRRGAVVGVSVVLGLGAISVLTAATLPGLVAAHERIIGFEVRDATEEETAAASITVSEAGGWVWIVTLDRACTRGAPRASVDFASSVTAPAEDTRTYPLENTSTGQVLFIDKEGLPPYAVLRSVVCDA